MLCIANRSSLNRLRSVALGIAVGAGIGAGGAYAYLNRLQPAGGTAVVGPPQPTDLLPSSAGGLDVCCVPWQRVVLELSRGSDAAVATGPSSCS
jgi:hypothetical protein